MKRFLSYLVALVLVAALVSPVLATEVAGTVKTVNAGQNQFVLTDTNGRDWTIQLGQNATIQTANNNQARINDLKPGQVVTVNYELQNNVLVASQVRGQAQQAQANQQPAQQAAQQPGQATGQQAAQNQETRQGRQQVRGKIEKIDAEQHQFTLKDQKGRELTFRCGRDAQINGKEGKLNELQQGQEVTVTFNQVLTDIRAGQQQQPAQQKQEGQMVQGKIDRVDAAQHQIQLRDQNGKQLTFQIGQNAQVQLDGRNATLADLQQGQQVTAMQQAVAREIRTGDQQNQNR